MNRPIVSCMLCATFVVMAGCKDRTKSSDAKTSSSSSTATAQPAVAVTPAALTGSWKQVGGDASGTTVAFKADGTFTSHVKTGWKKKDEPHDLEMRGKWKLNGKQIELSELFAGTGKDDMELIYAPYVPMTMPAASATTMPTTYPTTQESISRLRPGRAHRMMTETDTIVSISADAFKTHDEDGETRSYQREK
ncbi:MAG TPA: hypothetical protein VFE47_17090 [Tepidisphaeraceae bacterium]|nr:hypothetical protein [Tepidisphaeraceae bacterium]